LNSLNSSIRRLFSTPWVWSYLGALLVWLAAIGFTHGYGAGGMISAALALAAFSVITGVAQMFVITLGPGNIDLSLPANIGLASAVAMKVMGGSDAMTAVGMLAALFAGVAIGFGNYLLIWLLRIPPIIATLSASFIIQSVGISYGRGLQIKPPPGFADFTSAQVLGIPIVAVGTVILTIAIGIGLHRTIFGRSVLAIGQNPRAAWLAGVNVERTRCLTYVLSGALGGICGALLAGYFRGSSLEIGDEYLLASIALVVIGGTSVTGGKANVAGLWGAGLFLVLLLTMLNTFGVSAGIRNVVTGLVIIGVIIAAGGDRGRLP
jgi:ribose transport system permease protein